MKKNGEYVGVDDKYIPEDEKYVDESLLGNKEESTRKIKKTAKIIIIGYIVAFVTIFAIIIGIMIFTFSVFNKTGKGIIELFDQTTSTTDDDFNKGVSSMKESFNKDAFNNGFKSMQGTQSKFMLSNYLDKIVTNNKTNSNHIITVIYKETTTTTEDDIVAIKHLLDEDSKYEVSLDYGENGYINKVTIKDI